MAMEGRRGAQVSLYSSLTSQLDVGWVVNTTPRPLDHWERDLVPIVQEAGWAPDITERFGDEKYP
jgi:hypothetical protein